MSKIIKRILSMLAVLALVLTMAPAGILAVETKAESTLPAEAQAKIAHGAEVKAWADSINAAVKADTSKDDGYVKVNKLTEAKTCPVCGQENITWTRASGWNQPAQGSSASTRKYHHMVVDRNMTAQLDFVNLEAYTTVCILWLDGYTVTMEDYVYGGSGTDYTETDKGTSEGANARLRGWASQLSIIGNAKIVSKSAKQPMFNFVNTAAGCNTTLNLYGGTYIHNSSDAYNKGIIYAPTATQQVNIYNDVKIGPEAKGTAVRYNAYIGGILNMYGGTIRNGRATNGGNVCLVASASAKLNMYAGTLTDGYSTVNGGNLWVGTSAVADIYGGTIANGQGAANGGNIFANGTVNLGAVEVKDGKSPKGGNITIYSGKMTMSDDTVVTNGKNTAGYASYGGNLYLVKSQTGTTVKGTISGGAAINGGNIYMISGAADISATVSAGKARFGANAYVVTNDTAPAAGSVTFSGGSCSGGILDKLGADATPYAEDIFVNIAGAGAGMNVILKNSFAAEKINFKKSEGKNILTVDPSWTGSAAFESSAYYVGGAISDGVASAAFTGTLTNASGHIVPIVADGNGGLKLVDFVVIDEEEKQTGYATAEEALAAADKQPTKRIVTRTDFAMNGEEVVVDAINDVTVTGTGKIFGMDYDNNGYKTSNGWITAPEGVVQPEATVKGIRYVALKNAFEEHADAWSFHRVEIELTNVTVNVDKAGIYYKAQYKFDEVVKGRVDSYGVLLNLNEAPTEESLATSSSELDGYADATLVAASHGVYGIFKDGKESNLADGKTKVFGNPYLAINTTGEELEEYPMFTAAEAIGKSLADSMELANEKWDQLTPNGQTALNEFVNKWNALGAWETDLIAKLTNFTIA